MHRDIKPPNIVFQSAEDIHNFNITLIDFGFSTELDKIESLIRCGTPG